MARRVFSRESAGTFKVRLKAPERELLGAIAAQLVGALDSEQPVTKRLFPVAYPDDPAAEADYRDLMGSELVRAHTEALEQLVANIGKSSIDEEQLKLWMRALEVLRLVLGTALDVKEDDPVPTTVDELDPASVQRAAYLFLSALQEDAVGALASLLPYGGTEE